MEAEKLKKLYTYFVTEAKERIKRLAQAQDYLSCAFLKERGGYSALAKKDIDRAVVLLGAEPTRESYDHTRILRVKELSVTLLDSEMKRLHGLERELAGYTATGMVEIYQTHRREEGERACKVAYGLISDIRLRKAA